MWLVLIYTFMRVLIIVTAFRWFDIATRRKGSGDAFFFDLRLPRLCYWEPDLSHYQHGKVATVALILVPFGAKVNWVFCLGFLEEQSVVLVHLNASCI